ncbi:MAG: aminotransferase class III-fold pyridoxal phosphate-dependent enzyme [Candidatus Peribacteraceae bacterium]|nr:aminotransferase class III-fold pyridoxal phosphate-dependent enzyme [Candidatus Peribacteraceae bacterium]MDD5739892.1 aminotransferase class III-fold pyridoxal phosphate-dependent enzyme [Candidatus Peribacteraceae bacterium]
MSQTGPDLYQKARRCIPGGTQLLTKRPEMHLPDYWPSYYSRAKGVEVWDLDDKKYIDMSYNAVGASILGVKDPDVDAAVHAAIDAGSVSTLNCPEEVELAELLCELHPWAQMVRYARCGGEAMAIAVRIARAYTRRDRVAFCGYHGWHDWYLAANLGETDALDGHLLAGLKPAGVPRSLRGTAFPFHYNHLEELRTIGQQHGAEIAAVIMEPIRGTPPQPGFLEGAKELAHRMGAVFIFDEVSAGFRLCCGGAHLTFGVEPDMAVFAKAMSNGYPMAAVIGRSDVMNAAQSTFISSTSWSERIGPVAALATIRKHRKLHVHEHLIRIGTMVQEGWKRAAAEAGLQIEVDGIPPMSHFHVKEDNTTMTKTFFTQEMLERGFLAGGAFYATFAHSEQHVKAYLQACREVFPSLASALQSGTLSSLLKGPSAHAGFQRLT